MILTTLGSVRVGNLDRNICSNETTRMRPFRRKHFCWWIIIYRDFVHVIAIYVPITFSLRTTSLRWISLVQTVLSVFSDRLRILPVRMGLQRSLSQDGSGATPATYPAKQTSFVIGYIVFGRRKVKGKLISRRDWTTLTDLDQQQGFHSTMHTWIFWPRY